MCYFKLHLALSSGGNLSSSRQARQWFWSGSAHKCCSEGHQPHPFLLHSSRARVRGWWVTLTPPEGTKNGSSAQVEGNGKEKCPCHSWGLECTVCPILALNPLTHTLKTSNQTKTHIW